MLASAERYISPTRFHNSVHNAAAGYWSIATGATAAANALCAHDASFGGRTSTSLTQVQVEATAVLLIAYDASYLSLHAQRAADSDAFAAVLLLAPQVRAGALARLTVSVTDAPAARMDDAAGDTARAFLYAACRCCASWRSLRRAGS